MFNSIEQLFYEPIKELDNFSLIKENITYQDFIELYLQLSVFEEKINLLQSLINIFSHKNSLINICFFCLKNNKLKEIELELDDNLEKSNISSFLPKESFQLWLIEKFFEEKNEKIKLCLKELFIKITSIFGINKYYLNGIYEELTKIYFYSEEDDNININNYLINLKFLAGAYNIYIEEKDNSKNSPLKTDKKDKKNNNIKNIYNNIKPYNFYIFKGKENINITPLITSNEKSKINDGITLFICFNCILNPIFTNMDKTSNKNFANYIFSTIFNITFNSGNKLSLKIDANMQLILILNDNKKNNQINVGKIEDNKWYNISINLNINKKNKKFSLNIIINNVSNTQIKEIEGEYAKLNEINNIKICENFIGFMTDFILFNKIIEKDIINVYQNKFKYGLYKYNHIKKFIENLDSQILINLIVLLIPNYAYEMNKLQNFANNYEVSNKFTNNFDIKYISSFSDKIIIVNVIINNRFHKKINLLGGIENILPCFEILTKISKDDIGNDLNIFQNCLLVIFSIINSIIMNNKTNLEIISKKINFFGIMSTFLQNLNITSYTNIQKEIFNDDITRVIIDLLTHLFDKSQSEQFNKFYIKSFLNSFLFNVKIIKKFSLQNQNLIFEFISNNITKISQEEIPLLNVDNLLFVLQYYNENYKNIFCCDYHQNFYGENNKKIIDLKNLFNSITQIIGKISKFNEDIYIKILHFVLIRTKPCLIKFIIKNIFIMNLTKNNKNKNGFNKNEKNKFVKYLVKNDLLNTLLFLISTYVYPDIINEIINLFSIIAIEMKSLDKNSNINNFFDKETNINFISNSILPIYIRIKPLQYKDDNNSSKKIAMSEIVVHKNSKETKNINNENNINNISENVFFIDENDNNEDDIDINESCKKRFINSEKSKIRSRKSSGDNYYQMRKLNLEKLSTIDLGNNQEDNLGKITKKLQFQDDSDLNRLNFENYNNFNKNNLFMAPRKLNSVVESVINFARITNKNMKKIFPKQSIETIYESSIEEYKKLEPILDKLSNTKIDSYKKTILEALMNWLKVDFSNYVLKIISIFLNNNKIEYIHIYEFIELLSAIINEQIYTKKNKLTTQLFDLDFYFWYIDCMFQFYLSKKEKTDLILSNNIIIFPTTKDEKTKETIINTQKKGLKILINLIINIKMEKSELIKLFDILLLCGTRIKKYYSLNQNTIIYLNNFYSDFFTDILKEYNKYYSSANSEQLLPIINICYEYMLFFNNENKSEEINNFMANDNQIFNGIMLSGINTNKVENSDMSILQISKFWTDYQLFKTIMNVLKQVINIENLDYKDDKFLDENILSHKKCDMFLDKVLFLCNIQKGNNIIVNNTNNNININNNKPSEPIFKEEIKNGELPLIYIISNLYVIILNLANKKEEKEEIINEYKMYIIFLILASTNLSCNIPSLNIIQSKVELILTYFIGFIIERYNNGLDRDLLIPCLIEVFILMIKILKRTYDQRSKRKGSKIFDKIISITTTQKKIDFSKCAVYKILSKDNMSNVFNKDFVTTMKKNNFQFFNDKSYLINLLLSSIDLKNIKKEIKNIFFAGIYLKKGHERITKINQMKMGDLKLDQKEKNNKDYQYDLQFFKMRRKISSSMENNLSALEEEIKLYKEKKYLEKEKIKLFYKKIKKKIFSFTGLWSYKDIFYKNDNNYDDEDNPLSEKNSSSENSLEDLINKQRNRYQNKHIIKYKLSNHYGKIPLRPILTPIYDINSYLPLFSLFKKENLFIENEEGKDILSIMNLNMNDIFNEEEENLEDLYGNIDEEETDTVLLNIFKGIFPNIYNNFKNKVYPNFYSDQLTTAPLSGFILNSHLCCYIIAMSHIKGFLYLDNNFCCFIQNIYDENRIEEDNNKKIKAKKDEDYDEEKQMCYGSYIKLNKSKYVYFKIKYTSIQFIFLRKYYYKDSALEIFTSKNKVYYLNFPDQFKRQNALNLLLNKFSNKKEIKLSKNKVIGYNLSPSENNYLSFNNNTNSDFILSLIDNWQDWNISTMELLLWLNILSNRSFNDLSQYPVFPWILTQYKDILNPTKEIALSKSYMPEMFSTNLKSNVKSSKSYGKSNSGDVKKKAKGTSFLKNFGKKKPNEEIKEEEDLDNNNRKMNNNEMNSETNQKSNNYEQFPVKDKKSQIILEKDIRNFSLPMGMMTLDEAGEKRKNNYIEKYTLMKKEIQETNQKENKNAQGQSQLQKIYIYGSHYSNPLYVCHYLTRIFPYSNISIELQGDKFDDPNRMLLSVNKSFEASASHEGDLRELCPEFFYLPELFINKNNLDLKIKDKQNTKSNDVTLPNWANNNNYIFITKLRTYLESEEVNKSINKWFDLIFGYKQKGKEAENAYNLFIPSSYDNFDINKEALTPDQKIYYLRLIEFGLTPHQIINKKFNKRRQKDNKKKSISESWREKEPIINQFENKKNDNNKNILKVLKLKFIDDENFLAILDNYQYIKNEIINFQNVIEHNIRFDSNAKYYIKKDKISKLKFLRVKNNEIMNKSYPIIIYSKGSYIAEGGYYDGRIIVTQLNTKSKSKILNNPESAIIQNFEIFNKMDPSPVIDLIITKDEKFIFSGSLFGSIVIYKNEINIWKKKYQINDHLNIPITSIYHNNILNLWGSAGYDGYVNLYTFSSNKKISSIQMEQYALYADFIFISSSPLACCIIYSSHNYTFYTYSLIGKLICKVCENESYILSPKILKESNFGEVLIYGNDKGQINMRYLPSLDLFLSRSFNGNEGYINMDLIDVSNNGWYFISWSNDNGVFYAIYDPSHISEKEELMIMHLANDLDE